MDPSCFDMDDLLSTVAIYYLTSTFPTSVMIYKQSRPKLYQMIDPSRHGDIKTPMAFGAFVSKNLPISDQVARTSDWLRRSLTRLSSSCFFTSDSLPPHLSLRRRAPPKSWIAQWGNLVQYRSKITFHMCTLLLLLVY